MSPTHVMSLQLLVFIGLLKTCGLRLEYEFSTEMSEVCVGIRCVSKLLLLNISKNRDQLGWNCSNESQ